ncbi:hypothetical protein [Flavobacterium flavipallidum]|uniref:Uncharacterized protein n=1 Tax=Flavobacterium flavipallidum TaxID=3139140 RepID=A0ABU9HQ95_9FLAO
MLQELASQIMDDPRFTEEELEEKIIQVFDLCHFIKTYKQSLNIIGYSHPINLIEEDGVKKGIYFCDLLYNTRYSFDRWFYQQSNLKDIINLLNIKELWFVLVVKSFFDDDLIDSQEFIERNKINSLYDKVFYFNFSQSTIKILK